MATVYDLWVFEVNNLCPIWGEGNGASYNRYTIIISEELVWLLHDSSTNALIDIAPHT